MMPVAKGVGHLEDVAVDMLVLADGPVALEAGGGFGQGRVEVAPHHGLEDVGRPGGVGAGQERGDLVAVPVNPVTCGDSYKPGILAAQGSSGLCVSRCDYDPQSHSDDFGPCRLVPENAPEQVLHRRFVPAGATS